MTERRAPRPVEEDEDEGGMSLAAMEETLKPQALETFAAIEASYDKFHKLQQARTCRPSRLETEFPKADEKKYQKLRST